MVKNKFRSGAASFYIVAFSTLILVIIAASFASAIIAEITRTSNADLAQSAYDAALAGVEDAKAAFINYQNCIVAGATATEPNNDGIVSCGEIIHWMENGDCDMVGHILGRIKEGENGEESGGVKIAETGNAGDTNNNMQQAYTCVIVKTQLRDYKADLNAKNPYRIIRVKLEKEKPGDNPASNIGAVRISWYSNRESEKTETPAYNNINDGKVAFQSLGSKEPAVPPTIGVQLIQTASNFNMSTLNSKTNGSQTDRATVYLVPTNSTDMAGNNRGSEIQSDWTFMGAYNGSNNVIDSEQVANTNDHSKDYPFAVYCPEKNASANAYACSATINLPEPIGGARSDETFVFVISLPYGQPATDFALELICKDDSAKNCSGGTVDGDGNLAGDPVATLDRMQVMIDSTGRANDLFRRLEIRLDPGESTFGFPLYAVQIDDGFEKTLTVTKETGNYSGYNNW